MHPVAITFWVCIAALAYIYAGYPLLVWFCGLVRPARLEKDAFRGKVSIVLVAYNEATRLRKKLDGLLASDCAEAICEILVGSDGSTDATSYLISEYGDPRVRLVAFPERRGKPACLNELIPQCRGEIIVLTDTRQEIEPGAMRRLLENFADVRVGVVSGELVLRQSESSSAAARGMGVYWRYEKFIRRCESRFRSVPGATGAFYAIRRNVFTPIPAATILDDVAIPMQIIARGYHCAFESGAFAVDEPSSSPRQESIRKRRTITGCIQLMLQCPAWLSPHGNPVWWEYVSHKILRLFSPLLLIVAAVTNVWLAADPLYWHCLALQAVLYLAAVIGWHYQVLGRRATIGAASMMFVALNFTTLAAWWDALHGRFTATWQKAA